MKGILFCTGICLFVSITLFFPISSIAAEDIFGLKIENINKNGADFYWSTSVETLGSVEYAYTKQPELYNPQPQSPQTSVTILVSATPALTISENRYVKAHHIKIDNLDLYYDPFVQYTIKSEVYNGSTYMLSGEFVLVDTKTINWWQTWKFAIFVPITVFVLGQITRPITSMLWKHLRIHTHQS